MQNVGSPFIPGLVDDQGQPTKIRPGDTLMVKIFEHEIQLSISRLTGRGSRILFRWEEGPGQDKICFTGQRLGSLCFVQLISCLTGLSLKRSRWDGQSSISEIYEFYDERH